MDSLAALLHKDIFNPDTLIGAVAWGLVFLAIATGIAAGIRRFTRRVESHLTDVTGLRGALVESQHVMFPRTQNLD